MKTTEPAIREIPDFSAWPQHCQSSCSPHCVGQRKATQTVKRITIFGRPGSGKSTVAKFLSKKLNVPLHHLDCYYFAANWAVRNKAEFLTQQQVIVDQDKWIVDGNNLDSLEIRYARSDMAIYLNRSKYLCYWRVCKRGVLGKRDAPDRPANCSEKITWILLKYIWKYERMIKRYLSDLQKKYPYVQLYEIKNDLDLEVLAKSLRSRP